MKDTEKEVKTPETENTDPVTLPDEKLKKVTGGSFDEDIPRVPESPIDDVKDQF